MLIMMRSITGCLRQKLEVNDDIHSNNDINSSCTSCNRIYS